MLAIGAITMLIGVALARGKDVVEFANNIFSSFVAVSGDAHQSRVAQDIFRQEIRYERSLQIREDIRDVNKMMLESVQTDLFIGSILLGVCFEVFLQGNPPSTANRTITDMWLVFACWSITFTMISLWLALCFQAKISSCTRERLLRKHRFQMPDEQLVGRMGGSNMVMQMAVWHDRMLEMLNGIALPTTEDNKMKRGKASVPGRFKGQRRKRHHKAPLRVTARNLDDQRLNLEPMRKGMKAWTTKEGGPDMQTILDMPSFLIGETLVLNTWMVTTNEKLHIKVTGEATLYVAAQCPPRGQMAKDQMTSQMSYWPSSQLPILTKGGHEAWQNARGQGEFKRVNGFSVYVDQHNMEIPLYKIVLQCPDDDDEEIECCIQWNFKAGCEGLLVMLRKGHIHCKEEDWPIQEFNNEIKQLIPFRDYSGRFMRYGVWCLLAAAFFTYVSRFIDTDTKLWGFEIGLCLCALMPAALTIKYVTIQMTGDKLTAQISTSAPELRWLDTIALEDNMRLASTMGASEEGNQWKAGDNGSPRIKAPKALRPSFNMSPTSETAILGAETDGYRTDASAEDTETPGPMQLTRMKMIETCPGLQTSAQGFSTFCRNPPELGKCREVISCALSKQDNIEAGFTDRSEEIFACEASLVAEEDASETVSSCASIEEPVGRSISRRYRARVASLWKCMPDCLKPFHVSLKDGTSGGTRELRATLRKFKIWTNCLRVLVSISVALAASSPHLWSDWWDELPWEKGSRRLGDACLESDVEYWTPIADALGRSREGSLASCRERCLDDRECVRFTHWPDGSCVLQGLSAVRRPAPGATSGPPLCDAPSGSRLAAAPADDGGAWGAEEGDREGGDAGREDEEGGTLPLAWEEWEVEWPPLFRPSAAALAADSETLWLAAGFVLRSIRRDPAPGGRLRPSGGPVLLPGEARALGYASSSARDPRGGQRLAALGDWGLVEVGVPSVGRELASAPATLEVLRAAPAPLLGPLYKLAPGLASMVAAAVWHDAGVADGSDDGGGGLATVILAASSSRHGGGGGPPEAALCAALFGAGGAGAGAGEAGAGAELRVLGLVESRGDLLQNATALHVCLSESIATSAQPPSTLPCGGSSEPVLWVALSGRAGPKFVALSLRTGQVLGSFAGPSLARLPPATASATATAAGPAFATAGGPPSGQLRGGGRGSAWASERRGGRRGRRREGGGAEGGGKVVALTGNATHLVALVEWPGRPQQRRLFAVAQPPLVDQGPTDAEL